jgi:hypothetical protein
MTPRSVSVCGMCGCACSTCRACHGAHVPPPPPPPPPKELPSGKRAKTTKPWKMLMSAAITMATRAVEVTHDSIDRSNSRRTLVVTETASPRKFNTITLGQHPHCDCRGLPEGASQLNGLCVHIVFLLCHHFGVGEGEAVLANYVWTAREVRRVINSSVLAPFASLVLQSIDGRRGDMGDTEYQVTAPGSRVGPVSVGMLGEIRGGESLRLGAN